MKPLQHILAGSDLSDASSHAVERGYLLAQSNQVRYSVLYALGLDPIRKLRELLGQDTEALTERMVRMGAERLEASMTDLNRAYRVSAEPIVVQGQAGPALLSFVDEQNCDLLMVGNHGSGVVQRLIVGSTTSRVLRQSKSPVLVVKNKPREPYQRVLIAVDFSPVSQALVRMSRVIAPDAQITLLHVCSDAMETQMRYASVNDALVQQYRTNSEHQAHREMEQLARDCDLKPDEYVGIVSHGRPVHEVIDWEERHQPDLIMLGKHGTHATEELLLGSVTKRAIEMTRADTFVMVDERHHEADEM
jgi:nucleotide-binding universal stress UspA family protein